MILYIIRYWREPVLEFFNRYIFGVMVPLALIAAGVFYALRLWRLWLRHPGLIIYGMLGRGAGAGMPPLRALSLALAGTLGVGNIVGVASAVYLGGPGAVFWMWISALAAMLLKYAETVIAQNHRRSGRDGEYHGGPMFYIRDFFGSRGLAFSGRLLASLFALLCIIDSLTMGCVIQVNAVTRAFYGVMGLDTALCGGVFAFLAVAVIVTGAKGISELTERLVPFMTVLYVVLSLTVMLKRSQDVPAAFGRIFSGAFSLRSAGGGGCGICDFTGDQVRGDARFDVKRGRLRHRTDSPRRLERAPPLRAGVFRNFRGICRHHTALHDDRDSHYDWI